MTDARVRVVDIDDDYVRLVRPAPEERIGADESARLTVVYAVNCAGYAAVRNSPRGATEPALRLVVRERGLLGLENQFRWPYGDELLLDQACER